jgi:hypothetical protein
VTREVAMFATRQNFEPLNAEANKFLFQVEQEFDLMRLSARRASLEQEERHLAEEQQSLRSYLRLPVVSFAGSSEAASGKGWMRGWWRVMATRAAIWRLGFRRERLAEEARRLVLLEQDIVFALRLRRRRSGG